MKKMMMILLVALTVLTACSPLSGKDGGDNGQNSGDGRTDAIQELKSSIDEASNPAEVKASLDGLMDDADTKTSDALILEYLNYMNGILFGSKTYDKGLMEKSGFHYISVEGSEQPVVDYHFIDRYTEQLSQELVDFAEFMALNSDQPWAMDAGIVIPLTDLADRIALGEKFIVNYPTSDVKEQVQTQYKNYLRSFLMGLDNTPLVQYDAKTVDSEFTDAFRYFLKTYPDLKTAGSVGALLSELEASNLAAPFSYGDEEKRIAFQKHIEELVNTAESELNQ